jgi:hypothetical protein
VYPAAAVAITSATPITMATALELVIARTAWTLSAAMHATSRRKPITEPMKRPAAISWLKYPRAVGPQNLPINRIETKLSA